MSIVDRLKRYNQKAIADALDPDFAEAVVETVGFLEGIEYTPVIHGKWIPLGDIAECSVCGDTACCVGSYCPTCGAKMDNNVSIP